MTTFINPLANRGKSITRGKISPNASVLYYPLPFSGDTTLIANIPLGGNVQNVAGIDQVQSMYVKNSDSDEEIVITFDNGFETSCPPRASAILPVFAAGDTGLQVKFESAGGVDAKVWFTNTREMPAVWVSGYPISGVINVTGSTIYSSDTRSGAVANHSLALAAGGVSQQLMAANANRLAFMIKNPGTPAGQGIAAPEPAYIDINTAAVIGGVNSIELLPGETLTSANIGVSPTQAFNVIATTIGHQITCKSW